ncbi:hypothetical protein T484DRAFT_2017529, partial [Baffinella frigidus]
MNGAGKTGGEGAARGGDVTAQGQLRLAPGATAKSGKRAAAEGYTQTFNANCLNCGVELHMSLGPKVQSFQCCQCYAVHQINNSDPGLAGDSSRKRPREKKDKKDPNHQPRELTAYNKFMRTTLSQLKIEEPDLQHRMLFKKASSM